MDCTVHRIDRYVMLGGHFDAWSDGAFDPAGATAILIEIAKRLSSLVASNGTLQSSGVHVLYIDSTLVHYQFNVL